MASVNLTAWFEHHVERITNEVRDAVIDTAREGAEEARNNVATRGTAKSGKAGRIETGRMINSINSEVLSSGGLEVEARFGFKGEPDYTVYQEGGFTHNRSGEWITGMYAVTDAAMNAEEKLRSRVGGIN